MAVEADPGAAARPFATPAGWEPVKGALVRLRAGLGEKKGLRAGEMMTIERIDSDGEHLFVKRDGSKVRAYFKSGRDYEPGDLAHGFDGWLPLHAAAALALDDPALSILLEAHAAAAAMVDASGKNSFELL